MKGRKLTNERDYPPLLFLLAMVFWFSHEMVLGGSVPFFRDLGTYSYPIRFSLAQSFKSGELPLWDRHMAMGFPLLADFQSGVFYPPHLFYLVLPFFTAVRATFLFHYVVAVSGSYMLCRHWNYPSYLAMIGAILFTLGGTIVSLTNLLNHFQTAVWLPWALLFWERCLQAPSWKNFLTLTLALLLQFLAGSPEFYFMSAGILFLDGLRIRFGEAGRTCLKTSFLLVTANLLVAGLAMVQLLSTIELFMESRGQKPITYGEASLWSLHPSSLLNLFLLDKEVDAGISSGAHLFFVPDIPFLISYYLGTISLLGICLWLFYRSLKEKIVVLALIIVSLVIALGSYTPVYPFLFRSLPLFSLIRYPEKFFFFTHTLLLLIVLRGLFNFLQADYSHSKAALLTLASVCMLLLLLYLLLRFDTVILSRFVSRATRGPLLSTATAAGTASVLVNLERQIALTFAIFLLLYVGKKGKLGGPLFQVLLVAVVFIDLNSAHRPYQFLLNPDLIYKSPRVITAPDPEQNRIFYHPSRSNLHPNYFSILRQPSFAEVNSLVFGNLLPNTGVFYGFDYMQEIDALGRWPYVVFLGVANSLSAEKLYRLLGALNVKYIISFRPLPKGAITLVRHFPEHPSWLYKIDRVIPRIYIIPSVMVEKDPLKVLDQLSSAELDPLKEVILEKPLSLTPKEGFQAQAELIRYKNQEVAIRASLNGFGILVLADSFYPGWRVYVDGQEKEILRANLFFRAVPLSAGEHLVEFRYQPRSFRIGLIISLITLSGVVIGSILLRFVNQNKRHTGKLY